MVKVKIIQAPYECAEKYIGGIYEAFKVKYNYGDEYMAHVADNEILCLRANQVEEISGANACVEEFSKDVSMKDIMEGLGIRVGDIIRVNETHVMCNEKYDLVTLDNKYNTTIPGLILGMVSGKYGYEVFSSKHKVRGKENTKVPVTYI